MGGTGLGVTGKKQLSVLLGKLWILAREKTSFDTLLRRKVSRSFDCRILREFWNGRDRVGQGDTRAPRDRAGV